MEKKLKITYNSILRNLKSTRRNGENSGKFPKKILKIFENFEKKKCKKIQEKSENSEICLKFKSINFRVKSLRNKLQKIFFLKYEERVLTKNHS